MWSFLCVHVHTGVGHTDSESAQTFFTWKKITNFSSAPDGVQTFCHWIYGVMTLYQFSHPITSHWFFCQIYCAYIYIYIYKFSVWTFVVSLRRLLERNCSQSTSERVHWNKLNVVLFCRNRCRSRRIKRRATTWGHGSKSWCPPAGRTCAESSRPSTKMGKALCMNLSFGEFWGSSAPIFRRRSLIRWSPLLTALQMVWCHTMTLSNSSFVDDEMFTFYAGAVIFIHPPPPSPDVTKAWWDFRTDMPAEWKRMMRWRHRFLYKSKYLELEVPW